MSANKKAAQFLSGSSNSSLIQRDNKKTGNSDRNEKKNPGFINTNHQNPDEIFKVAVFDSKGTKTDTYMPKTDYNSNSLNLCELENIPSMRNLTPRKESECPILEHYKTPKFEKQSETQKRFKKPPNKILMRSKTKLLNIRKKRSKTDLNCKILPHLTNSVKETSTESILHTDVTTQTDQKLYCRKCQQHKTNRVANSPEYKGEIKLAKLLVPNQAESFSYPVKPNAFCTAVSVSSSAGGKSAGTSRVVSSTDLAKSNRANSTAIAQKRPTYDKNESIHQEIMNLKKTAEATALRREYSILDPLPFKSLSKTGQLYREIKRANKNGTLRYALSMLIFGILFFWLISATISFDFILEIFRMIGRYFVSLPIFITRRKRELTKAEIAVKYMGSFAKGLRAVLTNTAGSDNDYPGSSEVETIDVS